MLENASFTVLVAALVIFAFAMLMHCFEWASARGLAVARPTRRTRVLVGAGAGAGGGEIVGSAVSDAEIGERAEDGPSEIHEAAIRRRVVRWRRLAIALTVLGLIAQVSGVVLRALAAGRAPWGNMHEFTITGIALVVAVHLVLTARGISWLGLPVTMFATVAELLTLTWFYVAPTELVASLRSWWFLVHISFAILSSVGFVVGAFFSALYLLRHRAEKRETVRGYLALLPSSERLDRLAYKAIAFGFPLFTFTVAAGAVWAHQAWARFWGWDPKETWSLITWAVFAAYLHARATVGWKGTRAAIIALVGAVVFWWNFVGINFFVTGLHSYAK